MLKKKNKEKRSFGEPVIAILHLSVSVFSNGATQHNPDRHEKDNAKGKTFNIVGRRRPKVDCPFSPALVSPSLRTTGGAGVIKLLNACRAKFLREVQVLIRKLRDFEGSGQIGELSRTYASRHIPAVSRCLQASCHREARFITQQSGRPCY